MIFFRGLLTERITAIMWARRASAEGIGESEVTGEVGSESYSEPAISSEEATIRPATATGEEI